MRLPVDVEGTLDVDLPGAGPHGGRLVVVANGPRVEIGATRLRDLGAARREARSVKGAAARLTHLLETLDLEGVVRIRGHRVASRPRGAIARWRLHPLGIAAALLHLRAPIASAP